VPVPVLPPERPVPSTRPRSRARPVGRSTCGQVRRLVEENAATAQADEATLANATLSEQTLLATTLIELRLADADIDLQQKTVDAFRELWRSPSTRGRRVSLRLRRPP